MCKSSFSYGGKVCRGGYPEESGVPGIEDYLEKKKGNFIFFYCMFVIFMNIVFIYRIYRMTQAEVDRKYEGGEESLLEKVSDKAKDTLQTNKTHDVTEKAV